MSHKVIRFRCRRCSKVNSAAASKAGKPYVCPSCFAPMIVPEMTVVARAGIPTAEAIAVLPPEDAVPSGATVIEPVESLEAAGLEDGPAPDPYELPSNMPDEAPGAEPDVDDREFVPDEQVGPEQGSRGRFAGVAWVVAIAAVGLLASLGVVAGLSRSQARRVALDRTVTVGANPPAERSGVRGAVGVAPVANPQEPRPVPEPAPVPLTAPATPAVLATSPAVPGQPLGLASMPAPEASDPPPVMPAPAVPAAPNADLPVPPAEEVKPVVVKRRQMMDQETLRKQLESTPELALLDRSAETLLFQHGLMFAPQVSVRYQRTTRGVVAIPNDPGSRLMTVPTWRLHGSQDSFALIHEMQPELTWLPWRLGDDCHLAREPAEELQSHSRALRNLLQQSTPAGDTRPDPDLLRHALLDDHPGRPLRGRLPERWVDPAAIPALLQLLMAERTSTRNVLVDVLSRIPGKEAETALARLCLFDLAPEVRERAILALKGRSAPDYRPALLDGFEYPWPPVADHAAEALVALEDRGAIPALTELLDRPDPEGPTTVLRYGRPTTVVRTLVRVNHLKNCLLCHAPSTSGTTDLVRGRVPSPGQPLPPPVQYYADRTPGLYVRAEVTYIRQDFSVTQPVDGADPWPSQQRYDYLVSERPAAARPPLTKTKSKTKAKKAAHPQEEPAPFNPRRDSVLFALRELTGKDPGTTSRDWKAATQ